MKSERGEVTRLITAISNQAERHTKEKRALTARITALEAEVKKALDRLEASAFTNAEHRQAADILRAALAGGE